MVHVDGNNVYTQTAVCCDVMTDSMNPDIVDDRIADVVRISNT